jgi:hypothetical protein
MAGISNSCFFTDWDTISNFIEDILSMLSAKFHFNLGSGLRRDYFFQKSTNQKQELPAVAMLANGSG